MRTGCRRRRHLAHFTNSTNSPCSTLRGVFPHHRFAIGGPLQRRLYGVNKQAMEKKKRPFKLKAITGKERLLATRKADDTVASRSAVYPLRCVECPVGTELEEIASFVASVHE